MKARTTHMFFRSSMTSRGDDCTLIREAYCTAFASILPTREVNDGRPRFRVPGGGCVMSPPGRFNRISIWFTAVRRTGPSLTHDHRWIDGVGEKRGVLRICDVVDPAELDVDS